MPWYGYIHPLIAVTTIVHGLFIGRVSLSKLGEWDFPLRRVRARTFIYFVLCALNLLVGLIVGAAIKVQSLKMAELIRYPGHLPVAVSVCVLALLAVLSTFGRGKPGEIPPLMRWHPVLIVASLGLAITNGFLVLLKVLRI